MRCLRFILISAHSVHHDSNAFHDSQDQASKDGTGNDRPGSRSNRQQTTRRSTRENRIPVVFLSSNSNQYTFSGIEHARPNGKVSSHDGSTDFDGRHHASKSDDELDLSAKRGGQVPLASRSISVAFETVPDSTANSTHGKTDTDISRNRVWARIPCVIARFCHLPKVYVMSLSHASSFEV